MRISAHFVFFCAIIFLSVWIIEKVGYICRTERDGTDFPPTFRYSMGMDHITNIVLSGSKPPPLEKEQCSAIVRKIMSDGLEPERLAVLLGVQYDTLYKAWKSQGFNGWAKGRPLDHIDTAGIIEYYARLGNNTAGCLAESFRVEMESRSKPAETEQPETETRQNATEDVTEQPETKRKRPSRWYYLADCIFFAVIGITGYEMHYFMGVWGLLFWGIYAAAVTISLVMAKDSSIPKTAQWGFTAVIIFEALAYFGHLAMANLLICNAAKAGQMPFFYNGFYRETLEYPFWIATVLGGVLSGIVIYVVWLRLEITKEISAQK